ncbi:sensor histidine kinase [Paenibacillus cymbidii]|uniref:sensor histidine kinase n=1 Tax=Paenibacillus cymbidii TaxID=1639034 RepID=UPI001080FA55|nr:sensor histidine kinase [Paenibacillus cymbidii]
MERWTLGFKTSLLGYLIVVTYPHAAGDARWYMLVYLLTVIFSFAYPVWKRPLPRRLLAICAAAVATTSALALDPLFWLLLPACCIDCIDSFPGASNWLPLFPIAVSAAFVPAAVLPLYGLIGIFGFMLNMGFRASREKAVKLEAERDKLRADAERMQRMLRDNDELMRQSEYTFKLEERNRLSQQIHDDVGHAMAGALIQLEAARTLLDTDKAKAAALIGNAVAISRDGLERIRQTLKNIKPQQEELGIGRLRLFVDELAAKHAVAATLTYDGELEAITPVQWQIIHSNATEAVTNALKYSGAAHIRVELRVLNTFVKATVADDGKGADKVIKGLGIVGMEERAAAAGGNVIVDGSNGFRVTTLLPRNKA